MLQVIQSPSQATYWLISGQTLFLTIHLVGLACFLFIVAQRLRPLLRGQSDFRWDRPWVRIERVMQFWLGQWRHPRYRGAGLMHILVFAGFMILATRAFSLILGFQEHALLPGTAGHVYDMLRDYATTVVFVCMVVAAVRRLVFRPARYAVPLKYGKAHTADAVFLLGLIALLMIGDSLFEGSQVAFATQRAQEISSLAILSLPWLVATALRTAPAGTLQQLHLGGYLLHDLTFFFLLCYRPFGIQFHVETSLFSVFFAKLDKGTVKPVRWGLADAELDKMQAFGVKKFEDFTWKHMLDFYSCADCGRCSDNCPANAVGRPLSPRFLSVKARDYCFEHYPVLGRVNNGTPLIGTIYSEDEIWSCTTCGACEEECPLLVEYIDKIVDLRRGMVDEGKVPQSLQKPLRALESRGNPYGKMEKKKADWVKAEEFRNNCEVKVVNGQGAEMLYFVDSVTSFDDRMQAIGRATAKILSRIGEDFAILGSAEKDSGHEVRRFGEETLFRALRDHNTDAINASGAKKVVTADPHAFNALKHDYVGLPPVEHISQVMAREVKNEKLKLLPITDPRSVFTYHDPCYLGRHNGVYDDPRSVLDAIPGLQRVEMKRSRDRSFCCGGGGLMTFYEPKEEQRIGVKRVEMAAAAGANVIVTACPFCLMNVEDAIKVSGMEGKMTALDLTELVERQMG
jgi:Fe-S oxidoreductase